MHDKFLELYGEVKATRQDVKWIKDKIAYQNGVLADHIKDSDKFRGQVTRNTVWRHVFKTAIVGLFIVIGWITGWVLLK